MSLNVKAIVAGFFVLMSHSVLQSQSINFGGSGLSGESINNQTSLYSSPNNKLFDLQQDSIIWDYKISRDSSRPEDETCTILDSNKIALIKNNTLNYDDDGTPY